MWRDEIQNHMFLARLQFADGWRNRLEINRRAPSDQRFAKGTHPFMVLIDLLAACECAPWDQLMHICPACRVAHLFAFNARPGGRRDDLARLGRNVAETDFLIFFRLCQMAMADAGGLGQRIPCFDCHLAIGLRRQHQNNFGCINGSFDFGETFRDAIRPHTIQRLQMMHLLLGVPRDALAAIAQLFHQRPKGGEVRMKVGIVALHRDIGGRCLARDQVTLPVLPICDEGLCQFHCRVMLQRQLHHIRLDAENLRCNFGKFLGNGLEDFPVCLGFISGINRCLQRVDEGMHVGGVQVVLLIPTGRGQNDVSINRRC